MDAVNFKILKDKPDEDVLRMLRSLLDKAEKGEVISIAVVASLTESTFIEYVTRDLLEAIGLTAFLHHTLCVMKCDTREEG